MILELAVPLAGMLAILNGLYISGLSPIRAALARQEAELKRLEAVPGVAQAVDLRREIQSGRNYLAQFVHDPAVLPWCLRELSNITPREITLDRVVLAPDASDGIGALPTSPSRLTIAGVAAAPETEFVLVDFVRGLEHSPFFGAVKVISRSEESSAGRKAIRFTLEASLR
jgi:hypothetical protein